MQILNLLYCLIEVEGLLLELRRLKLLSIFLRLVGLIVALF